MASKLATRCRCAAWPLTRRAAPRWRAPGCCGWTRSAATPVACPQPAPLRSRLARARRRSRRCSWRVAPVLRTRSWRRLRAARAALFGPVRLRRRHRRWRTCCANDRRWHVCSLHIALLYDHAAETPGAGRMRSRRRCRNSPDAWWELVFADSRSCTPPRPLWLRRWPPRRQRPRQRRLLRLRVGICRRRSSWRSGARSPAPGAARTWRRWRMPRRRRAREASAGGTMGSKHAQLEAPPRRRRGWRRGLAPQLPSPWPTSRRRETGDSPTLRSLLRDQRTE